jgi:hypothetical protein
MLEFLGSSVGVSKDQVEGTLVSFNQLRNIVQSLFTTIEEEFTPTEYQEFFSLLPYNKVNQKLHLGDFTKLVYE